MTPDQIRWLTWGAIQHRPHGAPRWDEPGTAKAITDHCATWGLDIATEHVLAHARDPKARTPFAIKGTAPHNEPSKQPARPLRPDEACRNCGGALHEPNADCDARVPLKTADVSAPVAHLRALRDEATAELCSHGVQPTACLDHRNRSDQPDQSEEDTNE